MKDVKTKSKTKEVKVKNEDKTKNKIKSEESKTIKSLKKKMSIISDVQAAKIELKKSRMWVWMLVEITLFALLTVGIVIQNSNLIKKNEQLEELLTTKIGNLKTQVAKEFINSRKIYVCDVEKIYQELNVEERNKNFELELEKLNNEVKSAQRKINSLKKSNVKAEYSDVYLNSLLAKRDKIADDYQNALQQTLAYVNQALSEVAVEQGVNTIFRNKAMAVNTKYTIDVTPLILEKIKKLQEDGEGGNSSK